MNKMITSQFYLTSVANKVKNSRQLETFEWIYLVLLYDNSGGTIHRGTIHGGTIRRESIQGLTIHRFQCLYHKCFGP